MSSSPAGSRWGERDNVPRGADYDARWERLAAAGASIHGEADLIESLGPRTVLDAGCGTGRVATELARRGIEVVGVDLDEQMLDAALTKAPDLDWRSGDLVDVTIADGNGHTREFDVVAMAGNVMIFVAPGTEAAVVANLARHLRPGGHLVAGFEVRADRLPIARYDEHARAAGLELVDRWATWDKDPYLGGDYAVSLHCRPG